MRDTRGIERNAHYGRIPEETIVESWQRVLAAVGPRRTIGLLGGLFVAVAVGRAYARFTGGAPIGNVVIVTVLIAVPGGILLYGSDWLSRSDIDAECYPATTGWTLAGVAVMLGVLTLFHLQPDGGISDPMTSPPITTALASLAGFGVGIHDGRAKTRARALEESDGTGIGLARCERIVERHGGDIDVHSEPGDGTTVSLTLQG